MTTTPTAPEPFVTVDEVAAVLGVKRSWVYEKTAAGAIPFVKIGRYNRYRISDVIQALTAEEDRELANG